MKGKFKKKGISLIVLVITIIIMIILAAAVILSLNSSKIIEKANTAKTETDEARKREEAMAGLAEYQLNHDGMIDDEEATTYVRSYLRGKFTETEINSITVSDGKIIITSSDSNSSYLINQVTSQNYGDLVNYPVDLDNDASTPDWKIFYNDGANVYLIASNYAQIQNGTAGMSANGIYSYWENSSSQYTSPFEGTKENYYCSNALLDKDAWSSYKDASGYAEYALGAPTIEQFVGSYNEKYPSNKIEYKWQTEVEKGVFGSPGYAVRKKDEEWSSYISNLNTGDGLYVTSYSWWVAAPGSFEGMKVMALYLYEENEFTGNEFRGLDYDSNDCVVVRPVICLNSSVKGTQSSGTWTLSN